MGSRRRNNRYRICILYIRNLHTYNVGRNTSGKQRTDYKRALCCTVDYKPLRHSLRGQNRGSQVRFGFGLLLLLLPLLLLLQRMRLTSYAMLLRAHVQAKGLWRWKYVSRGYRISSKTFWIYVSGASMMREKTQVISELSYIISEYAATCA